MATRKICINFGCGRDIRKSTKECKWINVDCIAFPGVDYVLDLNRTPFPWKNDYADYIYVRGLFFVIDNIIDVMREMFRILKPGGTLEVIEAYSGHPLAFSSINTKHYFSYLSFACFAKSYHSFPREYKRIDFGFKKVNTQLIFGKKYAFWNYVLEPIFNLMPLVYEGTPLRMFPAQYIRSVLTK